MFSEYHIRYIFKVPRTIAARTFCFTFGISRHARVSEEKVGYNVKKKRKEKQRKTRRQKKMKKKKKKYDGLCQDPSVSVLKHGPRLLADRRGLGKHRLQGPHKRNAKL